MQTEPSVHISVLLFTREPAQKKLKESKPGTLNIEPLNGGSQSPAASALAQALPSCQQERGGRIGTTQRIDDHG
jgi:hypothetical protein